MIHSFYKNSDIPFLILEQIIEKKKKKKKYFRFFFYCKIEINRKAHGLSVESVYLSVHSFFYTKNEKENPPFLFFHNLFKY